MEMRGNERKRCVKDQAVDVPQWLRWLEVQTLGNRESNLARGFGDDYFLLFGADGKARLISHDLNAALGGNVGGEDVIISPA